MYNRIFNYLNNNNILTDKQYGFRERRNTSMALLRMINDVTQELDNTNFFIGLFLDLSKVFDTVNHSLQLKKIYHYGIRGTPHHWFTDYLSNRKQYASVDNIVSDMTLVKCGVPHESILGPLLLILFNNDIINASKLANFILFADDTNIFLKT